MFSIKKVIAVIFSLGPIIALKKWIPSLLKLQYHPETLKKGF